MAKIVQIQVITRVSGLHLIEVVYALSDDGRIWRSDPDARPAGWHEVKGPELR